MSKYRVISGPYFPVFGLNTKIYFLNLRIHSEYRKMRTRNNSTFGQFSRSVKNVKLPGRVIKSFCRFKAYSKLVQPEAVAEMCSANKVFSEISQNSRENTCVRVSFLIKLQVKVCTFIKKETLYNNNYNIIS